MSDGTEERDDLELDDESTDESVEDESTEESSDEGGKPDKRISDLQSRADRETARANKLEKQLEKLLNAGEGTQSGSNDPEREALLAELREASLDAVFGEFGELKDYGIDRALIEGRTRAEMRQSAAALVGLIKTVETKAKNRTLREHGLKADAAGSTRQPPKNYGEMSDEEFEREVAKAKGGGPSVW